MREREDFILNAKVGMKAVTPVKNGCDVFTSPHPNQDPDSTAQTYWSFWRLLPDKECVTVNQPGRDKGEDKLFCVMSIRMSKLLVLSKQQFKLQRQ